MFIHHLLLLSRRNVQGSVYLTRKYCSYLIHEKSLKKDFFKKVDAKWKQRYLTPAAKTLSPANADSPSAAQARNGDREKAYILAMFPYPSGNLHMGHVRVYTISDCLARYHRMLGKEVVHPIGWDAFGLPAENAAIERGIASDVWIDKNIESMKKQLDELCCSFDLDREFRTCDPTYYKWTQFIFLLMHERGLAYKKQGLVNWDPVDKTVLANEQIDGEGNSWRSGAQAEKKLLNQWYLRTSHYSKALYDGLSELDPSFCQAFSNTQKSWIGDCNGCYISFKIRGNETQSLPVYTSSPELLHGVAFIEVDPEQAHLVFSEEGKDLPDIQSVINPATGSHIPVLLKSLPSNHPARLGIPSDSAEDREVCDREGISWTEVLADTNHSGGDNSTSTLLNSGPLTGMTREQGFCEACKIAQSGGYGGHLTSGKLQDWLISRQRFWGTPIPIIHCPKCQVVPVPYSQLPVTLPKGTDHHTPLIEDEEWRKVECPSCGGPAERETDTMDTFVDSSWYFLRFLDPNYDPLHDPSHHPSDSDHGNPSGLKNADTLNGSSDSSVTESLRSFISPFRRDLVDQFMPVDVYVGGQEHAVLHMFYARFVTRFLCDAGLLGAAEPFKRQLALGTVHSDCYREEGTGRYVTAKEVIKSKDGETYKHRKSKRKVVRTMEKMSKSKNNGVNPQSFLKSHGVDLTRLYMLANTAPAAMKEWSPEHADKLQVASGYCISLHKWIYVLWNNCKVTTERGTERDLVGMISNEPLRAKLNTCVREVRYHMEQSLKINEALDALYQFVTNDLDLNELKVKLRSKDFHVALVSSIVLLHPFAPLITAELWEGYRRSAYGKLFDDVPIEQMDIPAVDPSFPFPLMVQLPTSVTEDIDLKESVASEGELPAFHHQHLVIPVQPDAFQSLDLSSARQLAEPLIGSEVLLKLDSDGFHAKFELIEDYKAVLRFSKSEAARSYPEIELPSTAGGDNVRGNV